MKRRLFMLVVLSLALAMSGCEKEVKISLETNTNPSVAESVQNAEETVITEAVITEAVIAEPENNSDINTATDSVVEENTNNVSDTIEVIDTTDSIEDEIIVSDINDQTGDVGDDILSIMLSDYTNCLGSQKCANLFTHTTEVSNIPSIGGTFNRTNVGTGYDAVLNIYSVTNEGFEFSLEAQRGANSGTIVEQAYFVSETCAMSQLTFDNSQYIVFVFNSDNITVYATGSSYEIGVGNGVSVVGEYVTGEVTHTNDNAVSQYFTEGQLEQLEAYLPAEYYEIFETTTQDGVVTVDEENNIKIINAFVSGVADTYGYGVAIVDGVVTGIEFADGTCYILPEIGC